MTRLSVLCLPSWLAAMFLLLIASPASSIMLKYPFDAIVDDSEVVIAGRVVGGAASLTNGNVVTDWTLVVRKTFKGHYSEPSVVVRTEGGVIGDVGRWVEDEPRFRPGDELLLALRRDAEDSWRVVGSFQGVRRVRNGSVGSIGIEFLAAAVSTGAGDLDELVGPPAEPDGDDPETCWLAPYSWGINAACDGYEHGPAGGWYCIEGGGPFSLSAMETAAQAAADQWSNAAPFWDFGDEGSTGNPLKWDNLSHAHPSQCTYSWSGGYISGFIIKFDPDYNWAIIQDCENPGQYLDFQGVAAHEFGHALGLGHSTCLGDVMSMGIPSGCSNRTLGSGDTTAVNYVCAFRCWPIEERGGGDEAVALIGQRDAMNLTFTLKEPSQTTVRIFDALGRLARILELGSRPAGDHGTTWDGMNSAGNRVAAGVYFYQVTGCGTASTRRMIVVP